MTEPAALTVPTSFIDISQLSEGLADRVDDQRIMLYGPIPMEEGAWVRFAVTLADQSVALEGMGRAVASIDGGEERHEGARFDIVLDSLQMDGTSEVVYERILMVRSQAFAAQPQTGEVSLDDVEQIEHQAEAADAAAGFSDQSTEVGGDDYLAAAEVASTPMEPYDMDQTVQGEQAAYAESEGTEPSLVAPEDEVAAPSDYPEPSDFGGADGDYAGGESAAGHVGDDLGGAYAQEAYAEAPAVAQEGGYGEAGGYAEQAHGEEAAPEYVQAGEHAAAVQAEGEYAEPTYGAEGSEYDATGEYDGAADGGAAHDGGAAPDSAAHDGAAAYDGAAEYAAVDAGEVESLPPSAAPPAPPVEPQGFAITPMGGVLVRPSRQTAWYPEVAGGAEPRPSSGMFVFGGGLPVPERAPRPDLDASLRISPAPRPVDPEAEPTDAPRPVDAHGAAEPAADAYGGYDEAQDAEGTYDEDAGLIQAPATADIHDTQDLTAPDQVAPEDASTPGDGFEDMGADAAIEAPPQVELIEGDYPAETSDVQYDESEETRVDFEEQ